MVMLPVVVVRFTAASPTEMSSAATAEAVIVSAEVSTFA